MIAYLIDSPTALSTLAAMAIDVYRDDRDASRTAILAHAGFDSTSDFKIARFSENADLARVHPGSAYESACLVLSGAMIRVDRRAPVIGPGSITVEPTWFEGTFTNDVQTEWLTVYVRKSRLDQICQDLAPGGKSGSLLRVEGVADPLLTNLIRASAYSLLMSGPPSKIELDGWAQVIGAHLLREHSELGHLKFPKQGSLGAHALKIALEFIESRLDSDLSVKAIAEYLGMGTTRLSLGFRQMMGRPLHQYVIERRVERARELIGLSTLPLSDVAYLVGFSSQSHMTVHFRRKLGITPAKYRKLNRS